MKKRLLLICLAVIMVLSLSLAACGSGSDDEGSAASGDKPNVVLLMAALNTDFFVQIEAEAQKYAVEKNINLTVVTCDGDSAKELSNMEDIVLDEPDIILYTPSDSDAATAVVETANDAGIPVITFDRGASGGEVLSHIASDNEAGGEIAGNYIKDEFPDGAKIAELQGILATDVAKQRGAGFNKVVDSTDNLEVVAVQSANFDKAEGFDVFTNILQAHPEVQAVFAHNDEMALGAMEAAIAQNRTDITIVGFDANAEAVAAVNAGTMAATVAQLPDKIIQTAIDTALSFLAGNSVESEIGVELKLVTK